LGGADGGLAPNDLEAAVDKSMYIIRKLKWGETRGGISVPDGAGAALEAGTRLDARSSGFLCVISLFSTLRNPSK
jgi:hypothetical protein